MKTVFIGIYIILAFIMAVCCIIFERKKNDCSKQIVWLIVAAIATTYFYTTFLMAESVKRASFLMGMYFICTDWLLFILINYVLSYTNTKIKTNIPNYFFLVFGVADSVILFGNNFKHNVFTLSKYLYKDNMFYWSPAYENIFYFHMVYCYFVIFCSVVLLCAKLFSSPKLYRLKYGFALVLVMSFIVINAFCFSLDLPIDYSILFYAVAVIVFFYFSLFAAPNGLVEKILSYVVEEVNSAMFCFDMEGKCVFANKNACMLFNIKDKNYAILEQFHRNWTGSHPDGTKDYEHWEDVYDVNGEDRYYYQEYQCFRDENNEFIGCFYKMEDRTGDILRLKEETYKASHDALTKLYNREHFFAEADRYIQNPENKGIPMYMVCTNIKDFKLINEMFGMGMGDEVLKEEADIIRKLIGSDEVAGRITGDHFAMVVRKENFDETAFLKGIRRLQAATEENKYKMHVYTGVYEIIDRKEPAQSMYDKANMAIETMRGDYARFIAYYDQKVMEQLIYEKNVVGEFDHALEDGQFCMYLQPQVNNKGRLVGAEALVRWKHPKRGLTYPDNFVGIIEKAGMAHRLDKYIWEEAAKQLARWKAMGREDLSISVNISAKDFYYLDIQKLFIGFAEQYQIHPGNLKLEITETALMKDLNRNLGIMENLQNYGFYFEIDDFGSGYSSLNMLKDIKADILKIDMVFLKETKNPERSKTILNSVIAMAKSLKMPVITEGVETKEQFEFLSVMGSDMFQGYYFSKPLEVGAFEEKFLFSN